MKAKKERTFDISRLTHVYVVHSKWSHNCTKKNWSVRAIKIVERTKTFLYFARPIHFAGKCSIEVRASILSNQFSKSAFERGVHYGWSVFESADMAWKSIVAIAQRDVKVATNGLCEAKTLLAKVNRARAAGFVETV